MKISRLALWLLCLALLLAGSAPAQTTNANSAAQLFASALARVAGLVSGAGEPQRSSGRLTQERISHTAYSARAQP